MLIVSKILVFLVALEHLYILWIEMFCWTTKAPKIFSKIPKDLFPKTKVMAANQGLYNGFLAIGLLWSLFIMQKEWYFNIALFFLLCIITAGTYGAITASKSIFVKQALPAIISLIMLIIYYYS